MRGVRTGRTLKSVRTHGRLGRLTYSRNGRYVLFGAENDVVAWDLTTGAATRLKGPRDIHVLSTDFLEMPEASD